MKRTHIIVVAVLAACLVGCVKPRQPQTAEATVLPSLEPKHGQTVSVFGTIAADPVPTLTLTSHRVENGRNVVRLKRLPSESAFPFPSGTTVHVSGVFLSQNLKVPEIMIEAIEKTGPNNTSDGIRQPADGSPKPSM